MTSAASLPERSVVATADSIYFKTDSGWSELTDGHHLEFVTDDDVDDLIDDFDATVLRVGDGT